MQIHPPYPKYNFFRDTSLPIDDPKILIDLSILAYHEDATVIKSICNAANMFVDVGVAPDFQVLTAWWIPPRADYKVAIVFKGTKGLKDWMYDFDAKKTDDGFHEGFSKACDICMGLIHASAAGTNVVFSGHSLGAGISVLAAARSQAQSLCRVQGVTNFGQPRVGDKKAVGDLAKTWTNGWNRYVHGEDFITKVPPESHIGDYVHAGKEILLERQPTSTSDRIEWKAGFIPWYLPLNLIDHVPTLYAESLWKA